MAGSSQEIEAGRAFVKLSTNDSAFEQGLKKAEARLKSFGGIVAGIGGGIAAGGGALLSPLLAGLGMFVEKGTEIQRTSDRLGISVEAVQTLGAAAKASGADVDVLGRAFFKFNRETGKGLDEFVKEMDALPNKTNAAAAAFDKFGRHGLDVLQVARHFAESGGVGKFMEGKKATILSSEDVQNAEKLHTALQAVLGLPGAISVQLGAALGGQLVPFVDGIKNAVKAVVLFVKEHRQIAVVVAAVGAALVAGGTAIAGFGGLIAGIGAAIPLAIVGFKALLVALAVVVGVVVQGYVAWQILQGLMQHFPGTAAAVIGWLGRMKSNLLQFVERLKETWSGIAAALKTGDWGTAAKIAWLEIKAEFWRGMRDVRNMWADWVNELGELYTKHLSSRVAAGWDYAKNVGSKSFEDALADARKRLLNPKVAGHAAETEERNKQYQKKIDELDREKRALIDEAKRKAALVPIPPAKETLKHGVMDVAELAQGTFSSYALKQSFGLANNKVTERIAKAAEATQENTKDIADKMNDGGLNFD